MQVTYRWSTVVLMVFALALPLKASGCGRTACITVTASQLQGGACPDPTAAQARFSSQGCAGPTVEGPGILDNELCCYPVMLSDDNVNCSGEGVGGTSMFDGETSTTGGFGGGFGGSNGSGGGATCEQALQGAPFTQVSTSSMAFLMSLETCACGGTCVATCGQTLCIGNAPTNGCLTCLLSNCSTQLMNCQQH